VVACMTAAAQDDYAAVAAKRAAAAVAAAGPLDADTAERARAAVAAHYSALNAAHTERDKAADKTAAKAKADTAAKEIHARFVRDLSAALTPPQVEAVKDHMTYGVLPNTLKAYREMLPALTEPQAARVRELLLVGREEALTAGSSEAKHATFGRAKGRANNYLSAQGYDLKKAGEEWAARRAAAAKKKSPGN
ncbi:DUF3826 domain-containing protein, partial [bacterium]|nr:DUF3826 domain-containing protein [bacterium]